MLFEKKKFRAKKMERDKPPLLITLSPEIYKLFVIDIHRRPCPNLPLLWECEKNLSKDDYKQVRAHLYIVERAQEYRTVTIKPQSPTYLQNILAQNVPIEKKIILGTTVRCITNQI